MSVVEGQSQKRNLVFTSAGDRSNLDLWLVGQPEFDLWVVYYGENGDRYRDVADHYEQRKGTKFPNLHASVFARPEIWSRYDAVMVMDDDIEIDANGINRLFRFRAKYDLWILQPAFESRGKVSASVTRRSRDAVLRFTDWVEVCCPLFRRDKLDEFLAILDPAVPSFGIDFWYMQFLGAGPAMKAAVIDAVPCVNPRDETKGAGGSEIDQFLPFEDRRQLWEAAKVKYGLRLLDPEPVELGAIRTRPQHLRLALTPAWLSKIRRKLSKRFRKRRASRAARRG